MTQSALLLDTSLEDLRASLLAKIPQLMAAATIPGLSLAIVRDGDVLWAEGFGCKHAVTGGAVTPDTVFEGASFSKPVFAYAVLKLCETGNFDLDTPLTEYLLEPYIPDDARLGLITARHVLGHTSGLPNFRAGDKGDLRIESNPGEKFGYSTEGYFYLQQAIERVVGVPLDNYMRHHLFMPLGMEDSSYVWMNHFDQTVGYGHDREGHPSTFKREHKQVKAGSSLHTRPLDFARFLIEMMAVDDGDNYRLTNFNRQKMLTAHVGVSERISWGLGRGLEETDCGPALWHWGDMGTYENFTVAFREQRIGIVIMTNGANGLKVCEEIVGATIGGKHPAFSFPMMKLKKEENT